MKPFDIPLLRANPTNNIGFNCGFLNEYLKSNDNHNQHIISHLFGVHRLSFFCVDCLYKRVYRAYA
ncbi:hypothetical protein [Faucicola boevrei]|uniref:hypothetical protein n=1 Tax=Faucicola boevrei TaxID=346665 RepID=UPI0003661BEE|nr:hypothetical protein [Moraxella boevrei]